MREQHLVRNRIKADALAPLWDLDRRRTMIMGGSLLIIAFASLILFS
jgi:hypothetical protein